MILPLMKPGLVVLGVFTFMNQWTSYLWPLVINTREEMLTLTVGVQSLRSLFTVELGRALRRRRALDAAADPRLPLPAALLHRRLDRRRAQGVTESISIQSQPSG